MPKSAREREPDHRRLSRFFIVWFFFCVHAVAAGEQPARYAAQSTKPFAEVLADLEFAVTNRNYRITGRNDIGTAIGEREGIAFPKATVLHFCNLRDAQELLELAPDYLLHMPCRVAVREHAGKVVVETQLLPENHPAAGEISKRINRLLKDIVDYAVE